MSSSPHTHLIGRRLNPHLLALGLLGAFCLLLLLTPRTVMTANLAPPDTNPAAGSQEYATLGGGCFWCLEAVYERFQGVASVTSGYAGGAAENPTYKEVCSGTTGHAEVVQIAFNPAVISFDQLLEIFWEIHDPTTPNRQGADEGTQYRSIILHHTEAQQRSAEASRTAVASRLTAPVVTEIVPLKKFYPAEEHHQDFYRRNPSYPYCAVVISPKLKKLEKLKDLPATH